MGTWYKTKMFHAAPEAVEGNTIKNVAVCTMGVAKGHGVHLDSEFIDRVVLQGNQKRNGLKARFGHPSMCSTALGTYLGTFKNFHRDGNIARADLHVSNEANNSPNGRLGDYVLSMAENAPESFGTSICFTPGETFRKDLETGENIYMSAETSFDSNLVSEELFVELDTLHGCDAVDEPAANEGLFSGESIAGQLEMFFQEHPDVFTSLAANPDVLDAIEKYGSNVNEFITAYQERLAKSYITQTPKKEEEKVNEEVQEVHEEEVVPVAEVIEETAVEESVEESAEPTVPEVEDEALEADEAPECAEEVEEAKVELSELKRAVEAFGAEIATIAFTEGGGYEKAQLIAFEALKEENEALKKQLGSKKDTTAPVPASKEVAKRAGVFNTGK